MNALFNPRAIAVIGASPAEDKLPGRPLAYLRAYGYAGRIYAVNPKYEQIGGVPCFPSVADLPADIDLALIMLSAQHVPGALEEIGRKGIPFAISVAGGFAEAGDPDAQARLASLCHEYGTRLIGPNCVGLINPRNGLTATFSTVLKRQMPRVGSLAIASQSGALANSVLQSCIDLGIGISSWVSVGNEADLGLLDFVRHFLDDPETRTIALFVEGLKDGAGLVTLGREARRRGKVIVALRAGKSQLGRAASVSHTGKLAGSPRVWESVARQAGVIEVAWPEEMIDLCLALQVFDRRNVLEGLGVLTISGGLGVLISDACAEQSIPVPSFDRQTQLRLRQVLPNQLNVANPVDTALFADETGFATCAQAVLEDRNVGTVLIVLTTLAHDYEALTDWLEQLAADAARGGKRIAVTYLSASDQLSRDLRSRLLDAGVLVLPDAMRLVRVLGHLRQLSKQQIPAATARATLEIKKGLPDATRLLGEAGIRRPEQVLCTDASAAGSAAERIGFPVALKIVSPDVPHKTEAGGVRLGLQSAEDVRAAYEEIAASVARYAPDARIEGIQVQKMVQGVAELIVGCLRDPELGPVIMVGSGGVFAELIEDVTFRAAPVTASEAKEVLGELKSSRLLRGFRGLPKGDIDAAAEAIAALSAIFPRYSDVDDIDLNPLIVMPQGEGVLAVDALIVGRKEG